ncbi:MAG: hypothetical protein JO057_31680 [Chloroflexi bacterium]|nr:hypothetical protein [Chloroflexota bacterium]
MLACWAAQTASAESPSALLLLPLPARHVAAPTPWLSIDGADLAAEGLALGCSPGEAELDPLRLALRFLLAHPASEGDQYVLDLGRAV